MKSLETEDVTNLGARGAHRSVSDRIVGMPWGQSRVALAGDASGTAVVFLHQSPLDSWIFRPTLAAVGASRFAVAIDTPGYGLSLIDGDGPQGVTDYAQSFWATLDAFDVNDVFVIGRATGTVFAAAMAQSRPERVQGLLFYGLPLYTEGEKADRLANFAPPYELDANGEYLKWIWDRTTGEYPWATPQLRNKMVASYLAAGPDFATSYRAIWRYDLRRAISELRCPSLFLAGTEDRLFFMHERARAMMPGLRELVVEGFNDFASYLRPELFAQISEDFISEAISGA